MQTERKAENQRAKALPRIPARQLRVSRIEATESEREVRDAMRAGSASEWLRNTELEVR